MADPQIMEKIKVHMGDIAQYQNEVMTSSMMRTSAANVLMFAPILFFNQGLFATFNRLELFGILLITFSTFIANINVLLKTKRLIRTVESERQGARLKATNWLLIGNLLYGISGFLISVAPAVFPSYVTSALLGLGATISLIVTGVTTRDWMKSKGGSK